MDERSRVIVAHNIKFMLPYPTILNISTEVCLGTGITRVEVGAAIQIHNHIAHGTSQLCPTYFTFPTEPATSAICTVVIIGSFTHLEPEEM